MKSKIDPKLLMSRLKKIRGKAGCIDGAYVLSAPSGRRLNIIASIGDSTYRWEHVSVSVSGSLFTETPTWEEMCYVKSIFWDDNECVIQFHPPSKENISIAEALHMWRPWDENVPMPPPVMV